MNKVVWYAEKDKKERPKIIGFMHGVTLWVPIGYQMTTEWYLPW